MTFLRVQSHQKECTNDWAGETLVCFYPSGINDGSIQSYYFPFSSCTKQVPNSLFKLDPRGHIGAYNMYVKTYMIHGKELLVLLCQCRDLASSCKMWKCSNCFIISYYYIFIIFFPDCILGFPHPCKLGTFPHWPSPHFHSRVVSLLLLPQGFGQFR